MRKLVFPLLAVILMSTTGCIQMRTETTITEDGSGTCTISYGMSAEVAEALGEMSSVGGMGDEQAPLLDDFKRDELEQIAGEHDVKITSFERDNSDENISLQIGLEFEDLDGLSFVLASSLGRGENSLKIFKRPDGNYVLKTVMIEVEETAPDAESDNEEPPLDLGEISQDPERQMELLGTLMSAAAELDIMISFTVPGEIVSSNAPQVEGRTSIWSIQAENMMSAGGDMDPYIVFSGKGLKIDAPDEQ